ncbi:enolase C-terminal domain-like protein [Brevundimonas sp. SL161]|uniref:enolase C-terminal domain-like protein n=1 Tax=Brevundimonas sp. SL161 TaxID=2804613 RepID=UPI003CF73519
MKIEEIEFIPLSLPIQAPILTCYGSLANYSRTLIKITTESGIVGWGEIASRYTPAMLEPWRQLFRGVSVWETNYIARRIKHWNYYPFVKPEPIMGAFEIACLDAQGKAIGEPVYRLLGGKSHASVPVASYIFFRHANAAGEGQIANADDVVAFAKAQASEFGFESFKLKGGYYSPEVDIECIAALRDAFPHAKLRIDPQGCWSPTTAVSAGKKLEAFDLEYLEDPVWGQAAMARVRDHLRTPLATNMCVTQFEEFHPAIAAKAIDVVLTDLWYWGGPRNTIVVDKMCHAAGVGVSAHSSAELGVGNAAIIHTAAAMPHLGSAIDCMNMHLVDDIIVGGKIVPKDGRLTQPDGPGLGVEIDEAKVEKYRAVAASGAGTDRFMNPALADTARPGWYPSMPAW